MISNPESKYRGFAPIGLHDRQWPNRVIQKPPIWMSTDLRDGNQALIDPMSIATKLRLFRELVAIGFKEIEVAFPAASETDFRFVRRLIEEDLIPEDVTIEVLTQAREDLIERTIQSLRGARRAIVHLYNPTAPGFRRMVYNTDRAGVKAIAENGTRWVKERTAAFPDTQWIFQYSPGNLFLHRTRIRQGGVRRGGRHLATDPRAQNDLQSAGHRGDVHAQYLCGSDRMDAPPSGAARQHRPQRSSP